MDVKMDTSTAPGAVLTQNITAPEQGELTLKAKAVESSPPLLAVPSIVEPSSTTAILGPNKEQPRLDSLDKELLHDEQAASSSDDDSSDEEDDDDDDDSHSDYSESSGSVEQLDKKARSIDSQPSDDAELDEDLAWIPREAPPAYSKSERLPVPVVIPQVHPGIKHPFSRAWAPILESRGVQREEFLAFMDHLNVCKAASPPIKVLMITGQVIGFTPVPFAFVVGAASAAIGAGATYAIAKYRIVRYLKRSNEEYFFPRGLCATIAKQKDLEGLTGIQEGLPGLAPVQSTASPSSVPSLRDRRLQAMGTNIAPIQYESGPVTRESTMLDRWTSRSSQKQMRKSIVGSSKASVKGQSKAVKKEAKTERKIAKAEGKGKFDKVAKLERKREKHRNSHPEADFAIRETATEKEHKRARKFLYVVIRQLDEHVAEVSSK